MPLPDISRALLALAVVAPVTAATVGYPPEDRTSAPEPNASYLLYVGAESADKLHRVRFGPEGVRVERTIDVGEMALEIEGPHGIAIDRQGGYLYLTTGHGLPDGKLWKYELGADTLVGGPLDLGNFPATVDITPDGLYAFIANFNLHGEMTPSSVSVVYTPEMMEVARTETCTMPHGSRVSPDGHRHFSVCMMDDQLVELDAHDFGVSRRFSVARGKEGTLDADDRGHHTHREHGHDAHYQASCSPTWADTDPDGVRLYVACNRSDEVLEINVARWELLRRFSTGRGPYNLEVTPDGRTLVVTLKQGNAVELIDLASGETRHRSETSTTVVHGVVTSPDSRYAFVSVEGVGAEPGKVDVFDLVSFERVASVEVGQQASGIAFWKMER